MPVMRTHRSVYTETHSSLTLANYWDHFLARVGYKRPWHRVKPGLYRLGKPGPETPVFVTSNYTLSFDALRSNLDGMDAFILVLDTFGVNVWCAAGKGTFGTKELIYRILDTKLGDVVSHRVLILRHLGAPGVDAHEVKKATGFRVECGPVRAEDIPAYMRTRTATPEMRRVKFSIRDRAVLIPIEVLGAFLPMLGASLAGWLLGGWWLAFAALTSILAGTALFPLLLPWLPFREFSLKGLVLGVLVMLPFVFWRLETGGGAVIQIGLNLASLLLIFPAITAFIALNFTGATPFTSKSGVRFEMNRFIPVMAGLSGIGLISAIANRIIELTGGV